MLATETEVDYLVLYGKARQKIRALELQLERLIISVLFCTDCISEGQNLQIGRAHV